MVSDECGWELRQMQKQLEQEAESFRRSYLTSRDVPYELRAEWEGSRRVDAELRSATRLTEYFDRLDALRSAFDRAQADPEGRIPLEYVGITISNLESGRLDADAFSHLYKHYRRWKSRMPTDYKAALAGITYPHDISVYIRGRRLTLTRDEAKREALTLHQKASELKDIYDSKKRELSAEAERALADTKELVARQQAPALSVVARTLGGTAASASREGMIRTSFCDFIARRPDIVPTVFVSYSHDSESHAARVLELAQRLRADGIDCWIDQFEQGPAEGFPRSFDIPGSYHRLVARIFGVGGVAPHPLGKPMERRWTF